MQTGVGGTFAIAWTEIEVDGETAPPPGALVVGAEWRWTGSAALRLDGPADRLLLSGAAGLGDVRQGAARRLRRMLGRGLALPHPSPGPADDGSTMPGGTVLFTDGETCLEAWLAKGPGPAAPLLVFDRGLPQPGRPYWVARLSPDPGCMAGPAAPQSGGVICFTPGTRIATLAGPRRIEMLRPGDRVLTRDDGPQPVLWIGQRRLSGARLHALPHLRPIRLSAEALGKGRPDPDLLVSPQHRMLLRGARAQALFGTDEVLVTAEALVNDRTIRLDRTLREVSYVHLALERHQIVWANGLETESFHPGRAALDSLEPGPRAALLRLFPALAQDPEGYGAPARRLLTAFETAVLRHDLPA